jgi:hypothetical protein
MFKIINILKISYNDDKIKFGYIWCYHYIGFKDDIIVIVLFIFDKRKLEDIILMKKRNEDINLILRLS